MNDKKKKRVIGEPSARLTVEVPPAAHYDFGCHKGQPVCVTHGLGRKGPLFGTVLAEYPSHIVVMYRTPDGSAHTTSITKASIICGDAGIRDEHGHAINPCPKEETGDSEKRKHAEEFSLV